MATEPADGADPVSQLQNSLIRQTHAFTVAVWELQQPPSLAEQDSDRKAAAFTSGGKRKRDSAGAGASTALGAARSARVAALAAEIGGRARTIDALIDALPGLGKTLLVKSIADAIHLDFARIQFTPDLMPADITGTKLVSADGSGRKQFQLHRGPIFHQIILADEVNRATPKTQSAMLEAMQERQVTILGETHSLPEPFFVVATQNPLEMDGTYPPTHGNQPSPVCKNIHEMGVHVPVQGPDASKACPAWHSGIPNLKSSGVLSLDGVLYWAVSCFNCEPPPCSPCSPRDADGHLIVGCVRCAQTATTRSSTASATGVSLVL